MTIAQSTPWTPYEQRGKGKGQPPVPEVAAYGLVLVILCAAFALWRRRR